MVNRLVVAWCVTLAGCATAAAPAEAEARGPRRPAGIRWDERPLEALLADAGRTGKRVVLDFWAEW